MNSRQSAILALAFGAFAIGFAPVFAAFALKPEYGGFGPASIGFYRILFALPLMWLVLWITPSKLDSLSKSQKRPIGLLALSGVFFAIDLVSWHWSIKYTSIANATLLANFAPLWVTLWARHLFGEKIHTRFFIALGIAIIGATILMRTSFQLKPEQLLGDLLSLLTAISYGSYMLTVKKLRETCPPQQIMAWSGLFAVPIMFFAAMISGESMISPQLNGWAILIGLALISHFAGQSLIAYAFGHLPASLTSLNLLLQPVFAAALGWLLLSQAMVGKQMIGAIIILSAMTIANRSVKSK